MSWGIWSAVFITIGSLVTFSAAKAATFARAPRHRGDQRHHGG
jgi:hypothetical protein